MTNDEIRARFDAENAAVYTQRLRLCLPEDEYSTQLMLQALEPYLASKEEAYILDLGAGTGGSCRHVLRAFGNYHVTLVDFSQNMLDEVPNVLVDYSGRYTTVQADIWEVDFPSRAFDAVVASFSLHHGRGETVYANLYRKVYAWLKTPGIFACRDVVDGDTPELSAMNESGWRQYLQQQDFSPQDIERLFSNYQCEDSPISLRQHLALLTTEGFNAADVLWKRFNFAIYVGLKSGGQAAGLYKERIPYS
jgi:tRNA (cmo5U34)-methyltransferase